MSPAVSKVIAFVVALLAILAIASAFVLDDWARAEMLTAQGKGWKKSTEAQVLGAISKYGDWPELMLLGGLGLLMAWKRNSREWKRILLAAMIASTVAGILANTSRLTTGRVRPRDTEDIAKGFYGPFHNGGFTIGNSKYNSFPSGHTATAVGFAAVLLFARPLLGVLAMLAAGAVAWSRMALGAHYLSDVVVATVLAIVVAWIVWRIAKRDGDAIAARVIAVLRKRKTAA